MKNLTKDQLIDLVFDNCVEITKLNSEKIGERVSNFIKGSENNAGEMFVKFVAAYGGEIKRECCQVIADTLYEILYSE